MTLSAEDIVAAIGQRRRDTVTIAVPEWGGDVHIRRLSAADLEATGMMSGGDVNTADVARAVLARSLCDEAGEPLFRPETVHILDDADATVTLRLFTECARINGLMTDELEDMTRTFAAAQPDGSSSS